MFNILLHISANRLAIIIFLRNVLNRRFEVILKTHNITIMYYNINNIYIANNVKRLYVIEYDHMFILAMLIN